MKFVVLVACALPLATSFVGAHRALSPTKPRFPLALPGCSPRIQPRSAQLTKNIIDQESPTDPSMSSKLYMRGLFSNGLGVAILWGVSKLDLGFYVALSASIQGMQILHFILLTF
jgi:hypothetical protein